MISKWNSDSNLWFLHTTLTSPWKIVDPGGWRKGTWYSLMKLSCWRCHQLAQGEQRTLNSNETKRMIVTFSLPLSYVVFKGKESEIRLLRFPASFLFSLLYATRWCQTFYPLWTQGTEPVWCCAGKQNQGKKNFKLLIHEVINLLPDHLPMSSAL